MASKEEEKKHARMLIIVVYLLCKFFFLFAEFPEIPESGQKIINASINQRPWRLNFFVLFFIFIEKKQKNSTQKKEGKKICEKCSLFPCNWIPAFIFDLFYDSQTLFRVKMEQDKFVEK